jgi:hypothetical protein
MATSTDTFSYVGASAKRGWYFNLPIAGERGLANSRILDKRLVAMPTVKPMVGNMTSSTVESCEPSSQPNSKLHPQCWTSIQANRTCKRPLFDVNNDGVFNNNDKIDNSNIYASRVATGKDPMLFIPAKSGKFETSFKLVSSRPGNASAEKSKAAARAGCASPIQLAATPMNHSFKKAAP